MIRLTALAATGAVLAGTWAMLPPTPAEISMFKENGQFVLRDSTSMPIYTYDRDPPGKSSCNGPCAAAWPPVAAPADSKPVGDWSVVRREDGTRQWAYHRKPVYRFAKDSEDKATGDGAGGVWHLVPPIP